MHRRFSTLMAGLLLAGLLPGSAIAAVPVYQQIIKSRHADAALATVTGCIVTEVFVSGMDAVYGGRPGPINRQGLAGVLVRRNDLCSGAASMGGIGIFAAGGGAGGSAVFNGLGQTLDRLGSTVHFDRAWLDAEIPVINEVSGEEVMVSINLTWDLVGELDRDTGHLHVRVPGEGNVNSHQNTLMGDATVSGTVTVSDEVLTFDRVAGAHLQQVKYGCQVIAHPSGEPDLSC